MRRVLGVGIIGAGPVTQALHLPALARLPDRFRLAHISAASAVTAPSVAARLGAAHSDNVAALLADQSVEVVAINSPSELHAQHAIAAMEAGKKAILIEKPLATSLEDARRIAACAERTGAFVMVGAMHVFDPGWTEARARYADIMREAQFIRSTVVLPPNPLFEGWSGEVSNRAPYPPPANFAIPQVRAAIVNAATLNLGVHDFPLIRTVLDDWRDIEVCSAQPLPPFGYLLNLVAGSKRIQLLANLHTHRWSEWSMGFYGLRGSVTVAFTPSYVPAGGAVVHMRDQTSETRLAPSAVNGYEAEWRHLHEVVAEGARPRQSLQDILDDFELAAIVAQGASNKAKEMAL
jgi:myo-inositol 2-dehydrogenase/D-chiro-inositol 1-dehydrogenase